MKTALRRGVKIFLALLGERKPAGRPCAIQIWHRNVHQEKFGTLPEEGCGLMEAFDPWVGAA